jgi:hypothetical protein
LYDTRSSPRFRQSGRPIAGLYRVNGHSRHSIPVRKLSGAGLAEKQLKNSETAKNNISYSHLLLVSHMIPCAESRAPSGHSRRSTCLRYVGAPVARAATGRGRGLRLPLPLACNLSKPPASAYPPTPTAPLLPLHRTRTGTAPARGPRRHATADPRAPSRCPRRACAPPSGRRCSWPSPPPRPRRRFRAKAPSARRPPRPIMRPRRPTRRLPIQQRRSRGRLSLTARRQPRRRPPEPSLPQPPWRAKRRRRRRRRWRPRRHR